jgi:chromosome segregation protein
MKVGTHSFYFLPFCGIIYEAKATAIKEEEKGMVNVLKRIRVHGFKTFAHRTELELDGSLVAVLGANGCGKSNLVDALVWALGETSVRALRASTPTEVIFSGSTIQKPLGMAEVSLWFDNETRWLPLEVDEIQITRRLYRSGDWECWINKTPARLRDIADLFAGTGLGRGGYAIIGQGEIESFLSASPEERRQWLEEVAGISLYRNRRRETLRDLESTRMHLQRVADVLNELEHQREPLREEAERAKLYRILRDHLRDSERFWLRHEWHTNNALLNTLQSEREEARQWMLDLEQAITQLERDAEARGAQVAQLETEMDTLRGVQSGLLSAIDRLEGRQNALLERERTLHELRAATEEELTDMNNRRQQLDTTLSYLKARLQTARAALQPFEERGEQLRAQNETHTEQLETLQNEWRQALQARARYEEGQKRSEQIKELMQTVQVESYAIEKAVQQAEHDLTKAKQAEQLAFQTRQQIEQDLRETEQTLQKMQEDHRHTMQELSAMNARLHALQESLSAGEGAAPSTRNLMRAVQKGELKGDYYTVAQILTVPEPFQRAIEAALGGNANDVIAGTETDARRAIDWLKQNKAGRVTFLPLNLLKMDAKPRDSKTVSQIPCSATELVQYDSQFRPAIEWLLRRVLVVDTLDTAVQTLKEWRDQKSTRSPKIEYSRIVTLEGDVLQTGGVMTGGRFQKERSGALVLKAECDRLQETLQGGHTQLGDLAKQCAAWAEKKSALQQQRQEAHQAVEQLAQHRLEAESAFRELGRQQHELETQIERLQSELTRINHLESELQDENALRQQIEALRRQYEETLQTLAEWKAETQRLQDEQQEVSNRLSQEEQRLQDIQHTRQARESRLQQINAELAQIQTENRNLHAQDEKLQAQLTQANEQLQAMRESRQQQLEEGFQVAEQMKTARTELQTLGKRERELDLQIARLEVRQSEMLHRWQQEFEEEDFESESDTTIPAEDAKSLKTEIDRLRRELHAMGEVNLGAVEEYERLSERFEMLSSRGNDLQQTCERLEVSLHEMDMQACSRFMETYEAVQQAFRNRFTRLFEGGEADLVLTEPADPLSSGVLIEAQPPGKRRQRLELLSGGERALTAAALLFAFLDVRPSPLCVLDEVDAALDGRNVERFVEHLKELAQSSQTLIITHNMITGSSAERWIGVTMSEPGISRVIPYSLQAAVQVIQEVSDAEKTKTSELDLSPNPA